MLANRIPDVFVVETAELYVGAVFVPELNLIFIHVMKTGGSSISDALMEAFPNSAEKVRTRDYQDLVHRFQIRDSLGFSKHNSLARYSSALEASDFTAIDVLAVYRNPVHRVLSGHFCPPGLEDSEPKFSIYGLYKLVRDRKSLFQMLRADGAQVAPNSVTLLNFRSLRVAAEDIGTKLQGIPKIFPHLNPSRRPGYERNPIFLAIAFLMVVTSHHVFDFVLGPGRHSTRTLDKLTLWALGYR